MGLEGLIARVVRQDAARIFATSPIRALFEKALNLTEGQYLEADEEYRVCAQRGSNDKARSMPRKMRKRKAADAERDAAIVKTVHGTVHGKTIELDEDLGVAEGPKVKVHVKIVQPGRKWGKGILRTAGALADDPEWDTIMEPIRQDGKLNQRPHVEEE